VVQPGKALSRTSLRRLLTVLPEQKKLNRPLGRRQGSATCSTNRVKSSSASPSGGQVSYMIASNEVDGSLVSCHGRVWTVTGMLSLSSTEARVRSATPL